MLLRALAFLLLASIPAYAQMEIDVPPSTTSGTCSALSGDVTGSCGSNSVGNLSHVTNASLANSGLVNDATTVNGVSCVLGGTCTITGAPTGSAGGDLGSTYPNPTVTNGSHITNASIANSALVNTATTVNSQTCTLGSTCTVTAAPSGSAGGDLGSSYPNPTVLSVAHVTTGTLGAGNGGTGISTSSSTGVAQVASGTWSVSTALANGTTATSQATGDTSTKVATNAFVLTDELNNARGSFAVGDFSTLANAVTGAEGARLELGANNYNVSSTLAPTSGTHSLIIQGVWPGNAGASGVDEVSALVEASSNINLLTLPTSGLLRNAVVDMSGFTNTAGIAVTIGTVTSTGVENAWIIDPFQGISINGNTNWIDKTYLSLVEGGTNAYGIGVGVNGGSQAIDPRVTNVTIQGNQSNAPNYGMLIQNAGGLFIENNDILFADVGTYVGPTTGQTAQWIFAVNSVLGDTTVAQAFVINPTGTGIVEGGMYIGDWGSINVANDTYAIANTGGSGTVTGNAFVANRIIQYGTSGFAANVDIETGTSYTQLALSQIAGFNSGFYGVQVASNHNEIIGNVISPTGMGMSGTGTTCINLSGTPDYLLIVDNDTSGCATGLTGAYGANSFVWGNIGIPNYVPNNSTFFGSITSSFVGTGIEQASTNTGGTNIMEVSNAGTVSNASTGAEFLALLSAGSNVYGVVDLVGGANPTVTIGTGAGVTGGMNLQPGAGELKLVGETSLAFVSGAGAASKYVCVDTNGLILTQTAAC